MVLHIVILSFCLAEANVHHFKLENNEVKKPMSINSGTNEILKNLENSRGQILIGHDNGQTCQNGITETKVCIANILILRLGKD